MNSFVKYISVAEKCITKWNTHATKYVEDTPTSIVTLATIRYIH